MSKHKPRFRTGDVVRVKKVLIAYETSKRGYASLLREGDITTILKIESKYSNIVYTLLTPEGPVKFYVESSLLAKAWMERLS